MEPEGAVVNVDKVTATDPTKEAPKYNITFTGLELGYYLVDTSAGTMLGLTTTDPNAVITAKNKLPSIQKEVKKHGNGEWGENNSKAIGETVTFRTTVTVEAGAKNYVVYDNMGDGLKFMRITNVYYASTRQQDAQTVYE